MRPRTVSFAILLAILGGMGNAMADELNHLRELFANPPREYTSAPLWVWNDDLTEEQIVSTLHDLASQNVRQAFVHPRPGLMTPYLSEDWFRLWKKALETAEELDMNIWIYDENSYPSGFAGGFVPEAMPEARGQGLTLEEVAEAPEWDEDILGVYALNGEDYTNVLYQIRVGSELPAGRYLIARVVQAKESPWFGGWTYVDLLRAGVTEKFLDITLGAYAREIGGQFGKRMPGVFTDEPHLRPAGQLHWTPDLRARIQERWQYDLVEYLPSLVQPVGDWRRIRYQYYQTLLDLFIARWAKPYYDYCEAHGLEFTGHYWEHGWPDTITAPDNMAMYAWHQRPAIDTLFNQYDEGVHAQFGNTRAVLELASVANQLGKKRTLCEAYGGAGWETRLEDMKRIGDWLYVLGVNTLDEHLSRISMRGARKADYPPSFSYHSPWWEAYHVPATYFARLSAALSHGKQVNEILVMEPTATAWMYQGEPAEPRENLGNSFQAFVVSLAQAQIEFDLGCESIIADHGSVDGKRFVVGERSYHAVVIPPLLENLTSATMDLLENFVRNGGIVYASTTAAPAFVDGVPSDRPDALSKMDTWKLLEDKAQLLHAGEHNVAETFRVRPAEDNQGILYHHRRQLGDGQLLFLVNTSLEHPARGSVLNSEGPAERWDLETGAIEPFAAASPEILFDLPPAGSLLLAWHSPEIKMAPVRRAEPGTALAATAPMDVRREKPNVLVLDFLDVTAGGETLDRIYYHHASEFAFQKHGLDNNPWDHAVQFKDNLVRMTFPADSGFTAVYHFTVDGPPPAGLRAVVERPDLYTITCNGQPLSATPGAWWFDKSFGVLDIAHVAKEGENTLTLAATPFTMLHEIAAVYILGDFAVDATDAGFHIAAPRPLTLAPWNTQGMPLYSDSVAYTQIYEIAEPAPAYRVELPDWYGSVAEVVVNGESAGYIWRQPWQRDLTGLIRPGANTVEVRVIGTPKNTMGPHFGNAAPGLAGPGHFRTAPETGPPPGAEYETIAYGLFAPFQLRPLSDE